MKSRICSLEGALNYVADGMSVGMGGILHRRRPLALCRELATRKLTGLHVYSFLAGEETEILAVAGAIATLTTSYVDPLAEAAATEASLSSGLISLREVSEHIFVGGLQAAANGLPFWPTLGAMGSDVAAALELRYLACPYTGREVLAVPATPIDVALIHAKEATSSGAVLGPQYREFLDDADLVLARAAKHVIVSVERIADQSEIADGITAALAPFEIHALVDLSSERLP